MAGWDLRTLSIAALGVLLLVQTLRLAWLRSRPARRLRAHRRRGAAGEAAAADALVAAGYRILQRHPRGRWTVWVDGSATEVELCPDFHVEKKGRRFVADAKTGKSATIEHAGTRRQLLEYREAFDVDGVLLVGPDGVQHIELGRRDPRPGTATATRRALVVAVVVVVVVVAVLIQRS